VDTVLWRPERPCFEDEGWVSGDVLAWNARGVGGFTLSEVLEGVDAAYR
jgi:hypothetical protein